MFLLSGVEGFFERKAGDFDVSDVENPKERARYTIGDRGTDSYALRDHKAFLFSRERGLLIIPILLAEINEEKYPGGVPPFTIGDYVFQGAYVFDVSLDGGFEFRGRVTHLRGEELAKSGFYFSSPLFGTKVPLHRGCALHIFGTHGKNEPTR
ncbi:MAG: beta-propeller domain-containing protein [Candidatus Hodarchaeaceae archaeon]|nr:beta-propeller domain-containing protein [Candidatus Hodarchaeaceae archaeon]